MEAEEGEGRGVGKHPQNGEAALEGSFFLGVELRRFLSPLPLLLIYRVPPHLTTLFKG